MAEINLFARAFLISTSVFAARSKNSFFCLTISLSLIEPSAIADCVFKRSWLDLAMLSRSFLRPEATDLPQSLVCLEASERLLLTSSLRSLPIVSKESFSIPTVSFNCSNCALVFPASSEGLAPPPPPPVEVAI